MNIVKTTTYEMMPLKEDQYSYISSEANIETALKQDYCLGFYAYEEEAKIGFALFREFAKNQFFLWDFIINSRYQGLGKGKAFLKSLIDILSQEYSAQMITTTYVFDNTRAKALYESFGFEETDVVHEGGIHEVNMKLVL